MILTVIKQSRNRRSSKYSSITVEVDLCSLILFNSVVIPSNGEDRYWHSRIRSVVGRTNHSDPFSLAFAFSLTKFAGLA